MESEASIIIPTLNNTAGVEYLLNYFKDRPHKIIIVDNRQKNLGFAGGVNKGAKLVKTKWMVILNDDVKFENDSIRELIVEAERKKLDALSPILVNSNGEVENYGYKILPYGKVSLVNELTSLRVNELDGLTAACLLVKTSVFKKLRGFDESFFAYLEDVDFFLRFKKSGYKMAISKNIKIIHNHMTTSKTMGNFKQRQDMINWWRLYFKHKDKFIFNIQFIIERLRNVSGYIKATFSSLLKII